MKVCPVCKREKEESDFYNSPSKKSGSSYCKSCFSSYCIQRWIELKKQAIIDKGSSCLDCGLNYPEAPYVVFEFHHRNPEKKLFSWDKARLYSKTKRNTELEKCDLLCSNCHKVRHHKEVCSMQLS